MKTTKRRLGRMNVDAFPHWDLENRQEFPDLRYNITIVKVPALYDWCKTQMYYDQDETDSNEWPVGNRMVYKEQDTAPWGTKEVYRLYSEEGWWTYTYLLCYKDRIIEIRFDWEPTVEQMEIVAQKLNSGDRRTMTLKEIDGGLQQGIRIPNAVVHQKSRYLIWGICFFVYPGKNAPGVVDFGSFLC